MSALRPGDQPGVSAIGFGPKSAWLAVPGERSEGIARSLELVDVRPARWTEVEDVRAHPPAAPFPVFVTPPVGGWTLALLAPSLAERDFDLSGLSRAYGEAQKFSSHRVVDSHEWQRWVDGAPMRRYWWVGESGEVLLDEGEPAAAEGRRTRADNRDGQSGLQFPDEAMVLGVAAEWSIDPTTLNGRVDLPLAGLLGFIR